jgi:hypothetical protein
MTVTIDSVQATTIIGTILREHVSLPERLIVLSASLGLENGLIGRATMRPGALVVLHEPTVPDRVATCEKEYE